MADLWATACWRARQTPWLSQAVAVDSGGRRGIGRSSDSGGRSGICLRTLAAVAVALACSSAVALRALLIGVTIGRLREKCGRGSDRGGGSASGSGRGDKYRDGDR